MTADSHDSKDGDQPVPTRDPALPFDSVVVAEGGIVRSFTPSEFFALPLAARIKYVVNRQASF